MVGMKAINMDLYSRCSLHVNILDSSNVKNAQLYPEKGKCGSLSVKAALKISICAKQCYLSTLHRECGPEETLFFNLCEVCFVCCNSTRKLGVFRLCRPVYTEEI